MNLRSYDVEIGSKSYRRNRRHLRQSSENNDRQEKEMESYELDIECDNENNQEQNEVKTAAENVSTKSPAKYVTRSGRTVKPPARFDDFVRN